MVVQDHAVESYGNNDNSDIELTDNTEESDETSYEQMRSQIINQSMDISHNKLNSNRIKDKSDHAVAEKVINRRIALILYRYRNSGFIKSIHGCISTGKEANVYYAIGGDNDQSLAIKIYKTSILDYKNRRRYLEGDIRLRSWNIGKNTRRIVRKWAEKEMRNLIRLDKSNINAPKPLKVRDTVLVMSFLGDNSIPYPTLKTASISESSLESIFYQGIDILKKMYHECKLVHGDFSEYNLLVNNFDSTNDQDNISHPILYVIDVSQSVENTSPQAFDFLKEDINNFLLFMSKKGLILPSLKTIFSLIIDDSINPNECSHILTELLTKINNDDITIETYHNDFVFRNTYIERNLHDVKNYEDDILAAINGTPNDMPYAEATGLLETFLNKLSLDDNSDNSDNSIDSIAIEEDFENEINVNDNKPKIKESADQRRERRKDNKILVKEANRERRKNKMPKKVKKMLVKKSRDKH